MTAVFFGARTMALLTWQVPTALWIRDHLPAGAVVATHDPGVMAFYSGRRVVDLVGVVTPELVGVGGNVALLKSRLAAMGVTHLAVMSDRMALDNQRPLFQSGVDTHGEERMEVHYFDPARFHVIPAAALELAAQQRNARPLEVGQRLIDAALQLDPDSATLQLQAGKLAMMLSGLDEAEERITEALELDPDNPDAMLARARLLRQRGEIDAAIAQLEALLNRYPTDLEAHGLLLSIHSRERPDPSRAKLLELNMARLREARPPAPSRLPGSMMPQ